ncbi:MAG: alpha/beta fold hydrolase [Bacteroidales bacterium]
MKLHYRTYGPQGPPLLIVHGMYGSGDNWAGIARELASDFTVYAIDQRNHGQSGHSMEHNYQVLRDDLCEFMDEHGLAKAVLIGQSMGGKAVMSFAMECAHRVAALISVDIAPRSYNDLALESRSAANHGKMIDAMLRVDLSRIASREDADQVLRTSIGSDRIRSFLLKNLKRQRDGSYRWALNLPALKENLDAIMDGLDVTDLLEEGGITGFPVLFVAGERSDYIRPEDHGLIRDLFPGAQIVTIPGAGHWVHAEQPELLVKNIRYFLDV